MHTLTSEQMERFYQDGYLKFGRAFSKEEVEGLREGLDHVIEDQRKGENFEGLPPEFAFGHDRKGDGERRDPRAIHQFVNMWKVVPAYRDVLRNPAIVGAMRDLMQVDRIRLWHDQVISKPPGDNAHFACHHDFYFWPLDRPAMISCWIALDDATADNGCMHVIPGSHRDPRLQPPDCQLTADLNLSPVPAGPGALGSLLEEARTWMPERAKPVELKAGECMFHHCLNWHMTPRNTTDRQRRALVLIFMPDGTRYKHSQSPGHICTTHLGLQDGALMAGDGFPLCG